MSEEKTRTLKDIVADIEELLDETWRQADYLCSACAEFDEYKDEEGQGHVTTLYMSACSVKNSIYTISAKLQHYVESGTLEDLDMFSNNYPSDSEGDE
jgi:hypothetical protein